ncbi:MAG: TatD family hydrolase, partial [Angelakisella sp.]
MVNGIFDSHAHYDDPRFDEDRDTLLPALQQDGIAAIMNIGADLATSQHAVQLAGQYDFCYAAVGLHPQEAEGAPTGYLDTLAALAQNGRVKAIGEIGLDYFRFEGDRQCQQRIFCEQLELAATLSLPVVIHNRDAHADTLDIVKRYRPAGVVHCFSGSAELATELVKLGFYLGFTGVITFKNAHRAVAAAAAVPLNRLLVETDCPYLAPEPYRGQRCDSRMLREVLARLADIKGI